MGVQLKRKRRESSEKKETGISGKENRQFAEDRASAPCWTRTSNKKRETGFGEGKGGEGERWWTEDFDQGPKDKRKEICNGTNKR